MQDFDWFSRVARTAVQASAALADIIWAIISDEEQQIPSIIAQYPELKLEGIDKVIARTKESILTQEGQMDLLSVYVSHRYDSGFRTDDEALREAYVAWKSGVGNMKLSRKDDPAPKPRSAMN